uniref:Integrase, catalytic region, zinc finger, CCHC-type, peptidase aspartic, catalytic n=1 Tax=Tanacetum cinerariifolium TaxID=118510 RepID=A0A6L2LCB2_TANCI|nr:integrase, catalytic region, zinc finger, CCHC-type, peptidase aspartic, catalytic [Tanacetum cinerariifolium]
MDLYVQNREHERMILESVENGPLIWPTVEENRVTKTKKYAELSATGKTQADCDMKATNIILQGLPADIYSLVNHHKVPKDLWERVQLRMQGTLLTKQEREGLAVHVFSPGDDPIACLNKAMAFLTTVASSRDSRWSSCSDYHSKQCCFQTEDFDTYDSDCDDVSNAKAVLMANIFNYSFDVISELALKEQVDSLEQNLSNRIKEKERLLQTFTVFKSEAKEKKDKYMENEIDLEKKIKKLDNIIFKVGQYAYTMHMLTKPQAFYDNIHKQALGYQNTFYLKKAQRIKPALYDGVVISNKHVVMHVIDNEETLILEEVSRSKMAKKIRIQRNRFVLQQELLADEAVWYHMLNPSTKSSNTLPVKIEAPKELSKKKSKDENVNYDFVEIETKNVELENSVAKLISENKRLCNEINHVKQVFKEQFDSIKKTRVRTKKQSDSLIDKLNLKSAENEDLKAQIQDKVFVITSLKNDLRKIKGKEIVDIDAQKPSGNTIVSGMLKLDLVPLAPKLLQNREAHIDYLKHTQEQADILQGIVEQAKAKQSFDNALDFAWRTFTIVGNSCPLTRITSANVVHPKKPTSHSAKPQTPELKVYSRKAKNVKNLGSSKKAKIVVQIVLWYLDFGCSKHMTGNCSQLVNFVSKFLGTIRFGNDHIARIIGYGDYKLGNVTISRVYYLEGLGHNLFYVGKFCDTDLEVAFQKNTCFIRDLEGVDLIFGSCDTNLYTIYLDDMLKTSPICPLLKASKTKSWLWHRRLSRLNFGTLNKLAKDCLARGIPRLKFQKDHMCSTFALGKSRKSSHKPKAEDTNQEKLYLYEFVWPDPCGEY